MYLYYTAFMFFVAYGSFLINHTINIQYLFQFQSLGKTSWAIVFEKGFVIHCRHIYVRASNCSRLTRKTKTSHTDYSLNGQRDRNKYTSRYTASL